MHWMVWQWLQTDSQQCKAIHSTSTIPGQWGLEMCNCIVWSSLAWRNYLHHRLSISYKNIILVVICIGQRRSNSSIRLCFMINLFTYLHFFHRTSKIWIRIWIDTYHATKSQFPSTDHWPVLIEYKSPHGLMNNSLMLLSLHEPTSFIVNALENKSQVDIIWLIFEERGVTPVLDGKEPKSHFVRTLHLKRRLITRCDTHLLW